MVSDSQITISSYDHISPYIPKNTRFVVLGTMATVKARHIDGYPDPIEPFYYHNPTNRFWGYMWKVFENTEKPKQLSVAEKQDCCERWGMALSNLVAKIKIHPNEAKNSSDQVIFKASRVYIKTMDDDFKKLLLTVPVFFTRYNKEKSFRRLIERFYCENKLDPELVKDIHYLHTPSRFAKIDVLEQWKSEFNSFGK